LNTEKNLIFIKNEDKTESITYCKYNNGKYDITFNNNKTYSYGYSNVRWLKDPEELNPETVYVYENNVPITGIIKIVIFEDYVRLIFKTGYKKLYNRCQLLIEKTCLENSGSSNCFNYLKQLGDNIGIKLDDDSSFLSKQYSTITNISPRSVLAKFLNPAGISKVASNTNQIIFPFGFNLSQKAATEKALDNQISIIEGPPGTGKTQTILNIIANAIMNNKTVAVVSNNNSATSNVVEKLEKYGLAFIAAYLGNSKNKEEFFSCQNGTYPEMESWKLEKEALDKLKNDLLESQKTLEQMLDKKNALAKLKNEFSNVDTEAKHFNKYKSNDEIKGYKSIYKQTSDKVMSLLVKFNMRIEQNEDITFADKIKFLLFHGIISFKFYNNSLEDISDYINSLY
jgi:Rad3-related DNA helicase